MIDSVEQFNERDFKDRYTIDFVVPSSGGKGNSLTTRKSVVLSFSNIVHKKDNDLLKRHAKYEIIKLLKVAGVTIKPEYERELNDMGNHIGDHKFGSFDGLNFAEQYPGTADWKRKQSGFKINWEEEERSYKKAIEKMHRDIGTLGMTTDHQKRQQVAGIISRTRFLGEIDLVDQLATLRRLSLLLEDNFDQLGFEDIGVVCSQMMIIIKDYNKLRANQQTNEVGKLKGKGESGYVFSWDSDGVVTITIPLNFKEWQLLKEFDRNLHVYSEDVL